MRNLSSAKMALIILAIAFILFLQTYNCIAEIARNEHPYSFLGNLLPGQGPKETYIGIRLGSYRPDLRQLDAILEQLNARAPGADTMFTLFANFVSQHRTSYLLEAGYWENETSIESIITGDISASLIHLSFSILYYPEMFQEYLPLYAGVGLGIYKLNLGGSAMEAIRSLIPDDNRTELGSNIVVGIKRMVGDRMLLNIQANQIFKNFTVDEESDRKLSFDGTDLSIGASVRF